jgi:ribosomal protein L15
LTSIAFLNQKAKCTIFKYTKSKINITAHYFSKSAIKSIEKAGGKVKKIINE